MKPLRRSALGVAFAAFVYFACFAVACATGSEEARTGFDEDAGKDAAKDVVVKPKPDDDSGVDPIGDQDSGGGNGCNAKVVINEVMPQGATATDEFIELYNTGTCAVSLSGWKIGYRSQSGNASPPLLTFQTGSQIAAKAFLLIGGSGFTGKVDATMTGGGMSGTNGQVALLDVAGKTVDGLGYGTFDAGACTYCEKAPLPTPAAKTSLARKVDGVDTDDNPADFEKATTPTPGAPN